MSASNSLLERKVKAAFLLNFARFISWPSDSYSDEGDPFTICIAENDPFKTAFSGVENKKIKGRSIRVKQCQTFAQAQSCQLLYIGTSQKDILKKYLETASSKAIVTVSDVDGTASLGGTIEFFTLNDRLSFKINNSKARAEGLNIDASLLDLAAEVY